MKRPEKFLNYSRVSYSEMLLITSRRGKKQCQVIWRLLVKPEPCLNLTSDSTGEIASIRLLFTSLPGRFITLQNEVT